MNEDLYGLQASGIDPEIAAQMLGLKSKKAIAQAMLQQSMQGIRQPETPSRGFTRRIHPLEAVADVVAAYMGQKSLEGIDQKERDLGKQNQERTAAAMGDYEAQRTGTPGMTPLTPNDDEGNVNTSIPAVAGDPRGAIANLLAKNAWLAKNPLVQSDMAAMKPMVLGRTLVDATGKTLATDSTWAAEQKVAAEAKKSAQIDALTAKEEENRVKIEAAAERQRQAAADRENLMRIAGGLRQPASPTMTEVIDPLDPTKMLRVDAKTYKGGSLGDVGVLGTSGKEPTAAKREETANQGRDGLAADLQLVREKITDLEKLGSMPSTQKSGLSNLGASASASGIGQFVGEKFGTKAQAARDEIEAAKRRILSSIKNITGASAQEMNSNVELKTWMDSLGNSKKTVEANTAITDAIENKYLKQNNRRASDKNTVIKFDAQGNPVQ